MNNLKNNLSETRNPGGQQTINSIVISDIDDEILQTLPENGSFAEKLPQFTDDSTNSSEEEPGE
ncbi:547_t:CDS:2 [Rhizophagus irregularis]|nr:547_t:CDS:2 [Rhizophagus irregularis]